MPTPKDPPDPAVLRVSGAATLAAACDTVALTVSFSRTGPTVLRATRAAQRALARFDTVLIAHAAQVAGARQLPLRHRVAEDTTTVTASVSVSAHTGPGLSDFLTAVHRCGPSEVSELTWLLAANNPVFTFARRAAADDVVAGARAHARALRAELAELVWLTSEEAPIRVDDNQPEALVRAHATAQFTITAPDLTASGDR